MRVLDLLVWRLQKISSQMVVKNCESNGRIREEFTLNKQEESLSKGMATRNPQSLQHAYNCIYESYKSRERRKPQSIERKKQQRCLVILGQPVSKGFVVILGIYAEFILEKYVKNSSRLIFRLEKITISNKISKYTRIGCTTNGPPTHQTNVKTDAT